MKAKNYYEDVNISNFMRISIKGRVEYRYA